jgi:tryptophanyl-tRNA synthetase
MFLQFAGVHCCCCPAGEVKAELITLLTDIVARHQKARAQVTEDVVDAFMAVRPMKCFC